MIDKQLLLVFVSCWVRRFGGVRGGSSGTAEGLKECSDYDHFVYGRRFHVFAGELRRPVMTCQLTSTVRSVCYLCETLN